MDDAAFDAWTKHLSCHGTSRRGLGLALTGTILTVALSRRVPVAEAKKAKGKKKMKKKAAAHQQPPSAPPANVPCVPSCAGKVCGGDGCGGSCGICAGDRSCQNGQCVCAPPTGPGISAPVLGGMRLYNYNGYNSQENNPNCIQGPGRADHCDNQLYGFDLSPLSDDEDALQIVSPVDGEIVSWLPPNTGCLYIQLKEPDPVYGPVYLSLCHFGQVNKVSGTVRRGECLGQRGMVEGRRQGLHISLATKPNDQTGIPIPFAGRYHLENRALCPTGVKDQRIGSYVTPSDDYPSFLSSNASPCRDPNEGEIVVHRVDEQGRPLPGGDYRVYLYDPVNGRNGGVGNEVDMPDIDDIDDGTRDGVATIFIAPGSYVINEAGSSGCPLSGYAWAPGKIAHVGAGQRVDITIGDYPQGEALVSVVDGIGRLLLGAEVSTDSLEQLPLNSSETSAAGNTDVGCGDANLDGRVRLRGLIEGDHIAYIRYETGQEPVLDPPFSIVAGQTRTVTLHACPEGVAGCTDERGIVFCGDACTVSRRMSAQRNSNKTGTRKRQRRKR